MLKTYRDLQQGSDEWLAARCGLLTASTMKNIITPKRLEFADNETCRAFLCELAAQRVTGHVEQSYVNDDMQRGIDDEVYARDAYEKAYEPVDQVGFITNNEWGFELGYSPDGLVGDDGCIEIKSRRQKSQLETIINGWVPAEYMLQIQTGLLVSKRKWCDFVSYCAGMPMFTVRINSDAAVQQKIVEAAAEFHVRLAILTTDYANILNSKTARLVATERRAFTGGII